MSLCRRDKTLQVSRWSTCRRFFLLRSHTMMGEGLRILPKGRIYQLTLIHSTSTLNTIRSLKPNDWTPIGRFAQVVVNGMDCILFLSVIDMQGRNKLFLTHSTRMRKGFGGVLLERGSERRKRGLSKHHGRFHSRRSNPHGEQRIWKSEFWRQTTRLGSKESGCDLRKSWRVSCTSGIGDIQQLLRRRTGWGAVETTRIALGSSRSQV